MKSVFASLFSRPRKNCVDGFHWSDKIPLCLTILETVDRGLGKIAPMDFIGPIYFLTAPTSRDPDSEKLHAGLRAALRLAGAQPTKSIDAIFRAIFPRPCHINSFERGVGHSTHSLVDRLVSTNLLLLNPFT